MATPTQHEASLAALLRDVRTITVAGRRLADDLNSGGHRSALRGSGIEFGEVREYVEGDDPRAVDASVSARMGRLFVKRFVDERERTAIVMLNVGPGMECGFGAWSLRDAGLRVMAAVAWSVIESQDRAGLITYGGDACRWIAPNKGPAHFVRLARWAIVAPIGTRPTTLDEGLDRAQQRLTRRSLVVVVTDHLDMTNAPRLARLASRHDVIVVKLLPPERFLTDLGTICVRDARTNQLSTLNWNQPVTRDAWTSAWAREDTEFMATVLRSGAEPILVPVPRRADPSALLDPLVARLQSRARRGVAR